MPMPTNYHTWEIDSNVAITGIADYGTAKQKVCWNFKRLICGGGNITTNPWTLVSSADASNFGAADYWNTTDGTNLDPNSWAVFERVDGLQMCLTLGTSFSYDYMDWVISPGGLFTGGALNSRPTASDEVIMANNTDVLVGNVNHVLNIQQSEDGLNFRCWVFRSGFVPNYISLETPEDLTDGAWTNPWIATCVAVNVSNQDRPVYTYLYDDNINNARKSRIHNVEVNFCYSTENRDSVAVSNSVVNEVTNEYPFGPIGLYCTTIGLRGRHGQFRDLWFGLASTANGDTYPADTSKQYVQIGDLIVPWDGSVPVLSA